MNERSNERCLWLNEEEAMGLLNIAIVSPTELTAEQRVAVAKLSEFCRQFLRDSREGVSVHPARNAALSVGALVA